jgi:hypothetical protein
LNPDLRGPRDFDVVIAWYGSDEAVARSLRELADLFVPITGGKFQNLWRMWRRGELLIEHYDSVFVADDDVSLESRQIAALFRRRRELDAWILTPAHSPRGSVSHPALLCRRAWDHHFTNFVEVNAPLFRSDALIRFLEEFDGSLVGWGVDHWYMNVLGEWEAGRYVVDDRVTYLNPKTRTTTGGREIDRLASPLQRRSEWHRVRDERGLREVEPVVVHAVRAHLLVRIRRTLVDLLAAGELAVTDPASTLVLIKRSVVSMCRRTSRFLPSWCSRRT